MNDEALAELLRETEARRLRALVDADPGVAEQLHADDYELVTPGGDTLSKQEYLAGVLSGELRYEVFEAESYVRVRTFADVGILRYRARIEILLPGGRDQGLFWHTDIYERRGDPWQVVWSQATRIR